MQSDLLDVLPHDAVNHVGVEVASQALPALVLPHGPEQRACAVIRVARGLDVRADALGRLRMDGERVIFTPLANEVERWVAGVHVEVLDLQAGDFCASRPELQADRENDAIAESLHGRGIRCVEELSRLRRRERRRRPLFTVHPRSTDFAHGVGGDDLSVDQVREQREERSQPAAYRAA